MLVFLLVAFILGAASQGHGPVFLLEPPAHLTFSNTSGSQVSCSAHGTPMPQVDWLLQDGQTVTAVPGLRQSLGNGTLYFPPFRAEDYRKDVHSTVYICRASNIAGTVLSRDVNVRAVVNQHYDVQVYHTHVLAGNTAVLACVIPSFVREYVSVTSWSRDDSILLPGSNMGGRIVVSHGTGELLIRAARAEDGIARYSCFTLHTLTHERKTSAAARLTVTEPTRSMSPRLSPTVQSVVLADRESDVHLTCSAQGNPPPVFNWFREIGGHLQPVHSSVRIEPSQDILHIKRLKLEDSGRWTCKVSNNFGEQRLDIHLTVTAHLSVHVTPQLQIINSGESAIFNCTVSGFPVGRIQWLRNGEPLIPADGNEKVKLLSPLVLAVYGVTRHDRGMYQCAVRNDRESCQGSAELRLGDTVPELQYTFIEQAMRPGPQVSLRCSATGSPPPQFQWLLDDEPISHITAGHRSAISQYVDHNGDVISHLNITNVRVEDGGLYSCRALNSLGSTEHSARLNIYGPPFIRSIGPVKAVAGENITVHCPYSGYPIVSVRWERHGQELPLDLRHGIGKGGSLTISRLDPTADSGFYACFVTSKDGKVARREIQLVVNSPPILEPFQFSSSLQEGGRAQVVCYVTSGDMPIHFAWYKDGEHISASLQVEERAAEFYSMLIFKEVSSRHSGAYTCVASNAAAKANYTSQLMVKVTPQWITEPQDSSVLLGSPLLVGCSATGFPKPEIMWMKSQGKTPTDYQPLLSLHSRATLMSNGSLWIEAVSPQDEGYYLCKATNGIGSGLSKVIFVGVNEPARFDLPVKNVSIKRGNVANLLCHVYGDSPIQVVWTLNGNRLDNTHYRYTVSSVNTENGMKSQVTIDRTDREDSGVYKCLAENTFGRSEHIINLVIQERPDPPGMLEVIEVASRSVRLSWRRPFDGNSPVISYLAQYEIHGQDSEQSKMNLTLPTSSHHEVDNAQETAAIGGLLPATVYKIRLLAVNSIDVSSFTDQVTVKTQEEEPSEPPRDVRVEALGPGELFLTWAVPPRESWNGDLVGYIISWNEHGAFPNQTKSLTVKGWATTKMQLTGLRKFTRYDINVRAFNSVSSGPASPTAIGTTKEGVPEAPPQDIMCSQISSQSMKVSWVPPPQNLHGGFIQGYKVYYRPIPNDNVDIPTSGEVKRTSSTETYLHALFKYTNYTIKVLAYTGAGDGVMSSPTYCLTEEDLPGPPADIKAAALTGESILVSWLPPSKPNGRISHYTVYGREAGRVGKHSSYNVRTEDMAHVQGLVYEVRSLAEHQLYEFWVSATTGSGEGEPTAIAAQATNSRAASRIASFSQTIRKAVKAEVLLPCLAVGNPTPRTLWKHRNRTITFSPLYEITAEGHLNIHSADQSLAGDYTCIATNLFGVDNITYSLMVLMPPSAPSLQVQFSTARSIRVHWTVPEDGGAIIQGYTFNTKHDTDDWSAIELSPEHTVYTLDNLRCGSVYHLYLLTHNRVGNGSPSPILTVSTKGGPPLLPKERDFISTNATAVQLSLYNWPDGGCAISQFSIQYRVMGSQHWNLISNSISEDKIIIQDLTPSTWYQLRISAENDAGKITGHFNCATTTLSGGKILLPPSLSNGEVENSSSNKLDYKEAYIIGPSICAGVLLSMSLVWFVLNKRRQGGRNNSQNDIQQQQQDQIPGVQDEKSSADRDNARNCHQVYTSSPIKSTEKIQDDVSGMYEISPYATFSVPANNSRSVTTSTLDYTMQFKTFGHIEDEDHNSIIYSKNSNPKHWHKHHRYEGEMPKTRLRPNRVPAACGDSESDTSGSPCGDCPSSGPTYRVPLKSSCSRSERQMAYTGYETLPVADLFRPDSSTESNDVSPLAERRLHHTPRHVGVPNRRHRPSSSSSDDVGCINEVLSLAEADEDMRLRPPTGFSDSRELSEAECDRDNIPIPASSTKLPSDLSNLLARYQERKEQERKEFTIHV